MDRVAELPEGLTWITMQIALAEKENYNAHNVPLMRDDQIIERSADQRTITKRYTEEAADRIYDGYDISPVMFGTGPSPRDIVYFYRGTQVFAIRKGSYKAHFRTRPEYGDPATTTHDPPLLYNLNIDPSEKYDIAEENPDIIAEIQEILEEHLATVVPVENQLER